MRVALDTNVLAYVEGVNGQARQRSAIAPVAAADLAAVHRLRIWDSLMVAVAAEGGCRLLLSEDLQDGFSWRGVTVVNPFAATRHPLLDAVLGETGRPA